MNKARISLTLLFLAAVAIAACGTPKPIPSEPRVETITPAAISTAKPVPSETATLEHSLTPTPALLQLEIVEWAVYPYANLADAQNTDTRVEILVRNPNEFPVRVNRDEEELRLLNTAGEIVYTNANPTFYIWEGSWILGGETVAVSACVCFWTDGVEKQEWKSLELVAPLEPTTGIAYTSDVEVTVGEFFSLAEAHLGSDGLGAEITLVNTSSQILKSFEVRVIARDQSNKYVGVAIYGSFVTDFSNPEANIEPGESGGGIVVSEIDYVNGPLGYEITAIGIPAEK